MGAAAMLSNASLSWEPVRMVSSVKKQSGFAISTRELSALDIIHDFYNSALLVYYVKHDNCRQEEPVAERLHRALEELLEHFPCAAGVLVHNHTDGRLEVRYPTINSIEHDMINAEDELHMHGAVDDGDAQSKAAPSTDDLPFGVPFHVAYANVALSDLGDVSDPHPSFDLLYPRKPTSSYGSTGRPANPRFIMAFQVTSFKCGGFTIGHACSHAYGDGYTASTFLQNLCSIARGAGLANNLDIPSTTSRPQIFSPREPPIPSTLLHDHTRYIRVLNSADRPKQLDYETATRFPFTMEALKALRAHIVSTSGQPKMVCTRNQALMALLWRAYARVRLAVRVELPGSEEIPLRFPVNLRRRGIPKLTDGYLGNAVIHCSVYATLQELCESPLAHVVDKIKRAMESMDLKECVQSMIDHTELQHRAGLIPSMELGFVVPSLVGLPFYDTDCGWGAPAYVGRPCAQLRDRCIIMDHPAAGAWNALVVFSSPDEHACFQEAVYPFNTV